MLFCDILAKLIQSCKYPYRFSISIIADIKTLNRKSGLLDSEDILVSRKDNSFVLTLGIGGTKSKSDRTNLTRSLEPGRKKLFDVLCLKFDHEATCPFLIFPDVSKIIVSKARPKSIVVQPDSTMVQKVVKTDARLLSIIKADDDDDNSNGEKIYEELVSKMSNSDKISLNQSLAARSKYVDEVDDYIELTNFDDLAFDESQINSLIDKDENISFATQNTTADVTQEFSIVSSDNKNNGLTLTESGSSTCTFKIEYPRADDSADGISGSEQTESKQFACRHCGKQYRWKSTLRRHENVECGGKEPSYECPYCDYKAKQRGNLGVHVRKHHPDMPQLETKRKKNSH